MSDDSDCDEQRVSYDCSLCNFSSPTTRLWLNHLRQVHTQDEEFFIRCNLSDVCGASYKKCSSFISHAYRHHRDAIEVQDLTRNVSTLVPVLAQDDLSTTPIHFEANSNFEIQEDDPYLQHAIDQLLQKDSSVQKKKAALYILNLKEIRSLSESAVEHVVAQTQSIFAHTLGRVQAGVNGHLSTNGIDLEALPPLDSLFTEMKDPFCGLNTPHLQEKFYREDLGCIDPVEVNIGPARYTTKFSGSKRRKALVSDTFQYIPIEETLSRLLQVSDVREEILRFHGSKDDVLRDMCDGSIYKNHPLFCCDPEAIQIIGYYDEVELCNPLGSSSKKHKVGCLFFSIGNLRPQFRSQLKCIFVAGFGRNKVIKRHGLNLFLRPFVESIKTLSNEGLKISVNGEERVFKVSLLAMLADTLAAHALGGFKESMSFARRICRSCMATTEQIQTDFLESDYELRTPEKHATQLKKLEESYAINSTQFGINGPSELDKIQYFSVTQNIPHDVMHDLLEGVVPLEMKLLLTYLVNDAKCFSIATLNDRLSQFDFGYSEKSDTPTEIDIRVVKNADTKIRESASKMWTLALIFPLLIGDLIPEDCKYYINFLLLLRICNVAMAWEITPSDISYLGVLIEEHHTQFKILYPDRNFIPKLHYMEHYPSQILRFGPLVYSDTMRHEAKLQVIKRSAQHGNFKNICYTIAKRSQHLFCYHLNCDKPFLTRPIEIGKTLNTISEAKEVESFLSSLSLGIASSQCIKFVNWVKYNTLHLKKYAYVYLGNGDMYPDFAKVMEIIVVTCYSSQILVARIQKCETLYFYSHFNGYVIHLLPSYVYVRLSSLPVYPVLHSHKAFNKPDLFITLKHRVM